MPSWVSSLFAYRGRIGRAPYLYVNLGIGIGWTILNVTVIGVSAQPDIGAGAVLALLPLWCLSVLLQAAAVVKRLHDLDRPGSHYWFTIVPIYNLYLGFHLLFTPGDSGSNRFGPHPNAESDTSENSRPRQGRSVTASRAFTPCREWVCARCGAQNETVSCLRCGAENFKVARRRTA